MFSPVIIIAAFGFAAIYLMGRYRDSKFVSPRTRAFLAGPTAYFLALGVPPLLYAAAGSAYTDTGMTVLLILDALGVFVGIFEAFFAHRFHPVTTAFLCGLGGFCIAVTYTDWPQVTHFAKRLPGRAAKAMSHERAHARALHGMHGQAAHQLHVLLIVAGIVVVVVYLFARARHNSRVADGAARPAIPAPVMDRELGVGSFIRRWFSGRRHRSGLGTPGGPGGIPQGLPQPPNGGGRRGRGAPAVPGGADDPAWANGPMVRS